MPDVYAAIAEVGRCSISYLSEVGFAPAARVLEVGCGTGGVTRVLARRPEVAEAVGVDPSPVFVAKASELAAELGNITDTRSLTAVRSASMPRLVVSKQACCASRTGRECPVSTWKAQGGAALGQEGAAWNRQPVLLEQHRVCPQRVRRRGAALLIPLRTAAVGGGTATSEPVVVADGRHPVSLKTIDPDRRTTTFDLIQFFTGEAADRNQAEHLDSCVLRDVSSRRDAP